MPEQLICEEAVYSEEYTDLIIDYAQGLDYNLEQFPGACIQNVADRQAVLYVPDYARDFLFTNLGYRFIPKCYGLLSTDALEETGVLALRRQPFLSLYGQGVLIGIVDDGINFRNDAFIWEDGRSKIVYAWNQTDRAGMPPEGFGYGSEYTEEMIRAAISSENSEEGINTLVDETGHGTQMAAAAGGRELPEEDFSGAAPLAEFAVVKLKRAKQYYRDYYRIADDAACFQENDIILAVNYLIRISEKLERPIVICLGLGTNQGDHNGSGFLGEYLNTIAVSQGVYICTATGNESTRAHHMRSRLLSEDEYQDMEINVTGAGKGFTMELWGGTSSGFAVQVKPPIGEFSGLIEARFNEKRRLEFLLNDSVVFVSAELVERSTGDELIFFRFVDPAEGVWTIRVISQGPLSGIYDAWLPLEQFNEVPVRFLMPDPDITICEPGNAVNVITWAGSDESGDAIYIYSGRGFTRNGRIKPDITAPASEVYTALSARSVRQFGPVSGTSMACALGGGITALIAEWSLRGRPNNTVSARNFLIRGADSEGISVPDRSFGYGRVDIYNSFIELLG